MQEFIQASGLRIAKSENRIDFLNNEMATQDKRALDIRTQINNLEQKLNSLKIDNNDLQEQDSFV